MKVGIDASRAFIRERTGTEEYAYQLIKNLTKINDPFCQFFLYLKKGEEIDFELPKNFHIRTIGRKKYWTQVGLSFELLKHPVDVLFCALAFHSAHSSEKNCCHHPWYRIPELSEMLFFQGQAAIGIECGAFHKMGGKNNNAIGKH